MTPSPLSAGPGQSAAPEARGVPRGDHEFTALDALVAPALLSRVEFACEAPRDAIVAIPAGPESSSLCLFALGALGAWQAGRSARRLNAGALIVPDWYQTLGRQQVGHATAFPIEAPEYLPVRVFEDPNDGWTPGHELVELVHQRAVSQFIPAVAFPRGPPR